jgi:hypothetical protein
VLNIDGVTGGFNFQAAWTTGYVAGRLMHGWTQRFLIISSYITYKEL